MTTLEQAKKWLDMGIAVIPLGFMDKKPVIKSWGDYRSCLPSLRELQTWFSGDPRNYGIVTGWQNLVVLDFDSFEYYFLWRDAYQVETFEVLTGRGVHAYFFVDKPVRTYHTGGIDIQASGAYVLGEGSIHPTGAVYTALNNFDIASVNSLNDILPEGFIQQGKQKSVVPESETKPVQSTKLFDPWEEACNPGQSLINAIHERIEILSFFPDCHKTGQGWYIARCPFHDDNNPSLWIDTRRGLCGCYAGCNNNLPLDVINVYAKLNNLSNSAAIEALRQRL